MGWGAGGLYVQYFTMNVGCAFIRPTPAAINLMQRVADRLSKAAAWDQQVFNSEAMLLSHGDYNGSKVSKYASKHVRVARLMCATVPTCLLAYGSKVSLRIMQFDKFVNSKVYFFSSRSKFIPGRIVSEADTPVMVHMSAPPALRSTEPSVCSLLRSLHPRAPCFLAADYHPDKHKRMLCVWDRYANGKLDACDKFPPGDK